MKSSTPPPAKSAFRTPKRKPGPWRTRRWPLSAIALSDFINRAPIPPYDPARIPLPRVSYDCDDDLRLDTFRPSRYTGAGEQRKGITMRISDASSVDGHISKATSEAFYLEKDTPLPREVGKSLKFLDNVDPRAIRTWWEIQLERLKKMAKSAADIQQKWGERTPGSIKSATVEMETVSLMALAETSGLG